MVQQNNSNDPNNDQGTYEYGRGNPNVQYQKTPMDVLWAMLAMVVLSIGLLLWQYDLSLVGFKDWCIDLFT
jgi:hypothetical protein